MAESDIVLPDGVLELYQCGVRLQQVLTLHDYFRFQADNYGARCVAEAIFALKEVVHRLADRLAAVGTYWDDRFRDRLHYLLGEASDNWNTWYSSTDQPDCYGTTLNFWTSPRMVDTQLRV